MVSSLFENTLTCKVYPGKLLLLYVSQFSKPSVILTLLLPPGIKWLVHYYIIIGESCTVGQCITL